MNIGMDQNIPVCPRGLTIRSFHVSPAACNFSFACAGSKMVGTGERGLLLVQLQALVGRKEGETVAIIPCRYDSVLQRVCKHNFCFRHFISDLWLK